MFVCHDGKDKTRQILVVVVVVFYPIDMSLNERLDFEIIQSAERENFLFSMKCDLYYLQSAI